MIKSNPTWFDFQKVIKDIDRQIKEAKNAAKYALTLQQKLDCINQVKALEKTRYETRKKQILNDNK